ncbi:hypothetical protein ACFLR8_04835 [Bacteroidota bacterium]
MNRILKISLLVLSMIMLFSCDYRKTHVTNTVHTDGSITRKVTVKTNTRKYLEPKSYDVPIDNTWEIEITLDVNDENDTSWFLTAEKHFDSVEEINEDYKNDKGSNRAMQRSACFSKSFKWFTTVFRFNETVERTLNVSCPISDFLSEEELRFFYLPQNVQEDLKNGSDSIKIMEMVESFEVKSEKWFWTCEMRQWIEIFYDLFENDPRLKISREEMSLKESQFAKQLMEGDGDGDSDSVSDSDDEGDDMDSLFITVLGEEFFTSFESEINHSITLLDEMDRSFWSSNTYDMEIQMPGKIIASNGYAISDPDSENGGGILWTIDPVYFLTDTYNMWVESRINNYFIWIITGVFILFVTSGFILYRRKYKGSKV